MSTKYTLASSVNTGDRLLPVIKAARQLSDGTLVALYSDGAATPVIKLGYSSDHTTWNDIATVPTNAAGGFYCPQTGVNDLRLLVDSSDNIYVIGFDNSRDLMRGKAYTKGAGFTWTAQTSLASTNGNANNLGIEVSAIWCNTGGGTSAKGHIIAVGRHSTGNMIQWVLDAGVLVAGAGTLEVSNASGVGSIPADTNGTMTGLSAMMDFAADGTGATSGLYLIQASDNTPNFNLGVGAFSITSGGVLTKTFIGATTLGVDLVGKKAAIVRYASNRWAVFGPDSGGVKVTAALYSSTAKLAGFTTYGAIANWPSIAGAYSWDVVADPAIANQVWLYAWSSATATSMLRLLLTTTGDVITWAASATADDTAVGAGGTNATIRTAKPSASTSIDWQTVNSNAGTLALLGDFTTFAAAPNAPTLTAPASGAYMDVSGGVTFSGTYNSNDASNQNAYALRAKQAGGAYVYWNAGTNLWQSTIVWNAVATTPGSTWNVTVPASATIANGFTLNWSMASQESLANLQGPFATDFVIVMQVSPTVTVTAPTGTVTTLTPTMTWTTTPAGGAAQTAYRVLIYTPAQYGAGGFVAGTTPAFYDSGVVASSNQFHNVPSAANLAAALAYRFYVQVTETGGETSTWQFSSATLSINPPADPTIVATPSTDGTTGAPRTAITVQGRDNLLTAEQASFEAGTAAGWAAGANSVIGATGFPNLLTAEQSSFEGGTTVGWTPTGATAANSTVQAAQGTHSMTLTATGANVISASTPTGVSGFAVTPLQEYTALASFRTVVTARAMSVKINWYQASGAASAVRASDTGTAVTDATGSWVQGFVSAVAPSDAAFAAVVVQSNVAVALSEVHYVDAISLAVGFDLRWALGGTTPTVLALDGQHSLAIAALAGANPASATTPTGTSGFAVTPSQQITALASVRAQATPRTCQLQINWYQASGAASAVRASDTSAGSADSTSAWTQIALTVTAPADAAFAAIVVLVTGALATGEEHFVDAIDYGPGSSTVWTRGGLSGLTTALVQFSDDGVTWTTLRTSGSTFPFPSQTLTFYDYEAPPGAVRNYRVQVQATVGGSATILSNFASTTATGTTPSSWVISDPTDPTSAVLCLAQGNPTRQLVGKLTMHSPFGRSRQVKVSDGVKGWAGRLPVRTFTTAQQLRLETLLARDTTLLIQSPEGSGRQWYANIDSDPTLTQIATTLGANVLGGVAGRGTTKMPHTDNVLAYAEAERP